MTLDSFSYLSLPHALGLPPMFSLSTRIEPSKPVGLVRKQIYTAHQHSYKPKFFIVQVQPKSVNKQNRLIGYEEYQNLHSDQILWREREREREIFSEQKEHVYQNLMQKEQHFSEHNQLELE